MTSVEAAIAGGPESHERVGELARGQVARRAVERVGGKRGDRVKPRGAPPR